MRVLILNLLGTLCAASTLKQSIDTLQGSLDTLHVKSESCPEYTNILDKYHDSVYNFTIEIFKNAAPREKYHFVMSPHSLWMTLAGVAEGSDPSYQQQLFELLKLPSDPCLRQKYYELAASRFSTSADVKLVSKRVLVIDEDVTPISVWQNYVTKYTLLEVASAPFLRNPAAAADTIRNLISARLPNFKLEGNSVLLDTIDYTGLWTTAFSDAIVKRAPFYSPAGKQIGAVDLLRTKLRCKIGYLPSLQAKVLELPVGKNGEYSFIIAVVVGDADLTPVFKNMMSTVITEAIAELKDSVEPIDVAIPRISMNSEVDMKSVLEDLGIKNLWVNPAARNISEPPALLDSYVQRATVTLDKEGVNPPSPTQLPSPSTPSDSEDPSLKEFIADRPFMFSLYDAETSTCITASMYTKPTYTD